MGDRTRSDAAPCSIGSNRHISTTREGNLSSTDFCCYATPETGPRWGTLESIVWPMILHRRPLADRGSPGRTNGNAVINPRIRVCSTVVLRSCLQPRATALWCLRSVSVNGGMPAPSVIDNEHQSSCVTTGCPIACSTTPLSDRPLLRCLEQAGSSALDHHVHRLARLGASVLIS